MTTNETPDLSTPQKIAEDVLSGNMHFRAWCAVVDALSETDPTWCMDTSKTATQNAVAWIRTHKPPC